MASSRVLILTNLPAPYRYPLWAELAQKCDLTVALLADSHPSRSWGFTDGGLENVSFLRLGAVPIGPQSLELDLYFLLRPSMLRRQRPHVVVLGGVGEPAYWQVQRLCTRRGIATVLYYESHSRSHRSGFGSPFRRWMMKRADAVVATTCGGYEEVVAVRGSEASLVQTFNTVDVSQFHNAAKANRVANDRTPGHRFVYVGQLIQRKNVAEALRAFAKVAQKNDEFRIVGSGPEEAHLRRLAEGLGIGSKTTWFGHMNEGGVQRALADSHTLVLPSIHEVWGLVANEASSCGLHVVVSESAGVAEFVAPMRGCYVVASTWEGLAKGMALSKSAWTGYVQFPEMLHYTPARAASDLMVGVQMALKRRGG